jgi:hypothetical protein
LGTETGASDNYKQNCERALRAILQLDGISVQDAILVVRWASAQAKEGSKYQVFRNLKALWHSEKFNEHLSSARQWAEEEEQHVDMESDPAETEPMNGPDQSDIADASAVESWAELLAGSVTEFLRYALRLLVPSVEPTQSTVRRARQRYTTHVADRVLPGDLLMACDQARHEYAVLKWGGLGNIEVVWGAEFERLVSEGRQRWDEARHADDHPWKPLLDEWREGNPWAFGQNYRLIDMVGLERAEFNDRLECGEPREPYREWFKEDDERRARQQQQRRKTVAPSTKNKPSTVGDK